MTTPSMSNTIPRNTRLSTCPKSRPSGLGLLVVFHSPNVEQIVTDGIGDHATCQLWQDMESDVGRNCGGYGIQHLGCANHQARECEIAGWMFWLLYKLLDDPFIVSRHYAAAPWVRNLIDSQRCGRLSLSMGL